MSVYCGDQTNSCINMDATCPLYTDCTISCDGTASCKYSTVTGPNDGNLVANCNGQQSCLEADIDGQQSSKLSINGCTAHKSCLDLSIHCPPNTLGSKNCVIQGNDNLGRNRPSNQPTTSPTPAPTSPTTAPTMATNAPTTTPTTDKPTTSPSSAPTPNPAIGVQIFAANGWDDVDVVYSGTFGHRHQGKMYCGQNYNTMCEIAPDEWSCGNQGQCGDIISSPTSSKPASGSNSNNIPQSAPTPPPSSQFGGGLPTPPNLEDPNYAATTKPPYVMKNNNSNGKSDLDPYYPGNNNMYPNGTYGSNSDYVQQAPNTPSGQLMILGGLALVILTCMCVGWAQARKECGSSKDKQSIDDHTAPNGFQQEHSVSHSHRSASRHQHTPRHGAHGHGHGHGHNARGGGGGLHGHRGHGPGPGFNGRH